MANAWKEAGGNSAHRWDKFTKVRVSNGRRFTKSDGSIGHVYDVELFEDGQWRVAKGQLSMAEAQDRASAYRRSIHERMKWY